LRILLLLKKNEIEEEKQELTNKQDELLKEQILMKEEILLKQKQLSNTIIENEELNKKKLSEAANNSAKELKKKLKNMKDKKLILRTQ